MIFKRTNRGDLLCNKEDSDYLLVRNIEGFENLPKLTLDELGLGVDSESTIIPFIIQTQPYSFNFLSHTLYRVHADNPFFKGLQCLMKGITWECTFESCKYWVVITDNQRLFSFRDYYISIYETIDHSGSPVQMVDYGSNMLGSSYHQLLTWYLGLEKDPIGNVEDSLFSRAIVSKTDVVFGLFRNFKLNIGDNPISTSKTPIITLQKRAKKLTLNALKR